jgi:hypothetical protein
VEGVSARAGDAAAGAALGGGAALVVALIVLSDPGAGGREDGNRIGVMMNTIAISTSAKMVRLSMQ